jgi:hypothetical protein
MKLRVLAIVPAASVLTFAVLDEGRLTYLGEVPLSSEAPKAAKEAIALLLRDLRPDRVCVGKRTGSGAPLSQAIFRLSARRTREARSLSASSVKRFVSGNGRASRQELAWSVAARFPSLRPELRFGRFERFEAVALALAAGE